PTVEAGMPMLQMIPPINRWISEAVYDSPNGLDNFFNIVFKNAEINKIYIDGRTLTDAFGGAKRLIQGTEYAYIRTPIGNGKHVVTVSDSSVRWTAWSYGSLDGLQQGRAYGSTIGVDYSRTCNDSISITTNSSCNTLSGWFDVYGDSCSGVAMIYLTSASNAQLQAVDTEMIGSKRATFTISKVDDTKLSTATIRGVTLSGKFIEHNVVLGIDSSFSPSKPIHEFGDVEPGIVFTDTLTLTNLSTLQPMKARLRFRLNDPTFSIVDTLPITLNMGESKKVVVTATGVEEGRALNDLLAVTDCGTEWLLTTYSSSYNRPKFRSSNVNFGVVPSNTPTKRTATITNIGLTTFTIIDHSIEVQEGAPEAFLVTADGERDLDSVIPFRLAPNKTLTITVTFDPKGAVGTCRQKVVFFTADRDTAVVMTLNGLATPDTTTSVSGEAVTTGLSFTVTPQPINETATLTLTTIERGAATIELIDLLGNVITSRTEHVTASPQSFVISGMNVLSGTYSVRVTASGRQASARIIIAR
ncbi:MAG TPA: T9SS type A sorting domain-containing protein, partial [Candidatus Didemnitutus sp.]|nr:T9SS type A sorting domain-containing protein [Candidatus Didemnitutus sp.]